MFFKESQARKEQIKQLEGEISAIYDGWADEIRLGHSNPAASEAFEPSRRLVRLVEQPLRAKADRLGIDLLPEWEEVEEDNSTERSYRRLIASGSAKLNGAIKRREQEAVKRWIEILVPIIGATTGLIGALAALFAVLHE